MATSLAGVGRSLLQRSPARASAHAASSRAFASKSGHIKLGLEWFWNPDHLPFLVAEKKKMFSDRQLTVDVLEPPDHWDAFDKLRSGELDMAVTETVHLVQERAQHGPSSVLGFSRFLHTLGGVMYRKEGVNKATGEKFMVSRPKDLLKFAENGGRLRIQYPGAPGPGGPAIVNTMIEYDGGRPLCPETEIEKVNEGFFHTKALKEDKADVCTLIFANFEVPEARAQQVDADFFDLKNCGVPDFCQLILMSTPEICAARKEEFVQFNFAVRQATDFIKLHPEEAKKIWFERFPAESAAAEKQMQEILDMTLFMFPAQQDLSVEYWANLEKWLKNTKQVEIEGELPKDYWTNNYLF